MPPSADKNYFELFGVPLRYELDLPGLSARYRELAREAHPDRFATGTDAERRLAMQITTLLNEAYRVLKDPIARASYLLSLKGGGFPPGTVAAVDPAFLVEQMELREQLEEAHGNGDELTAMLRDVRTRLSDRERSLLRHLSPASWHPEQALRTVQEMQFLDKLRHQIADVDD